MALSILIFHYIKWTTGYWNPISPFGVLGIYGVSVFFVLSGMVLTLSTEKKILIYEGSQTVFWKRFFIRRGLRIFPLLGLATFLTLILDEWNWSKIDIFLNFSGLFGFFKPANDIATGAWSIGCELVYYTLFPLIWWLLHPNIGQYPKLKIWFDRNFSLNISKPELAGKIVFWMLFGLSFIPFCWYAFYALQPEIVIQNQWALYVEPLNHLMFFLCGIGLAKWNPTSLLPPLLDSGTPKVRILVFASFLLFFFFYTTETPSDLVTNWTRLVLSFGSVALCWFVFKKQANKTVLHPPLKWLGDVSYSLYLLHPIVYRIVLAFFKNYSDTLLLVLVAIVSLGLTLILSHFVYFYFEKKAMLFGQLSKRKEN